MSVEGSKDDDRISISSSKTTGKQEDEQLRRKLNQEIRREKELNEDLSENRKLRGRYAVWVYGYLVGYSASVFLLLVCDGFGIFSFSLPESTVNFLVGSTAVSAIGLVLTVATGLFKSLN